MSQTTVRVFAAVSEDAPIVAPENSTPLVPLRGDVAGNLWTKLSIGGEFFLQGVSNADNKNPSSAAVNAPTVSFSYLYDGLADIWRRLPGESNREPSINLDAANTAPNMRAVTFGYAFDEILTGDWARIQLRSNNANNYANDTTVSSSIPVIAQDYAHLTLLGQYVRVNGRLAEPVSLSVVDETAKQVVSFPKMRSEDSTATAVNTSLTALNASSYGETGRALLVAQVLSTPTHDAPAADTAAVCGAAGSNGAPVMITGIGFSLTAVAAVVAPVLVELREDIGGLNQVIWSTQLLAPAGTSKEVMLNVNMTAQVDCQLTVAAPGATNFVTATLVTNPGIGNGSPAATG